MRNLKLGLVTLITAVGLTACGTGEYNGEEAPEVEEAVVCPADTPFLNEDTGECMECITELSGSGIPVPRGCGVGEACFHNVCLPVDCERDLDCRASDELDDDDVPPDFNDLNYGGDFCDNGLCVPCVAVTTRTDQDSPIPSARDAVVDLGCTLGEQCIDLRCVPVEPVCTEDAHCDLRWPTCYRGFCVGCVEDSDCPGHGDNAAVDIACVNFECQRTDLGGCQENADCHTSDPCMQGVCEVNNRCSYYLREDAPSFCRVTPPAEEGEAEAEGESEGEAEAEAEAEAEGGDVDVALSCEINWQTPNGRLAELEISTQEGRDGVFGTMTTRCGESSTSISCPHDVASGDEVCISGEAMQDGVPRYSCTGDGVLWGPMTVTCDGEDQALATRGNALGGCNRCFIAS